jgi:hypothetical protein
MDQPGIGQFIVDAPSAPTPQQFYPAPAPAAVYVARPRSPVRGGAIPAALLIVLLVVAILCICMQKRASGCRRRGLAASLAARGWYLYTRPGCSYCTKQLAVLNTAAYPKQVVCVGVQSSPSGVRGPYTCMDVKAFPFWANEHTQATRTGLQNRQQLESMLMASP